MLLWRCGKVLYLQLKYLKHQESEKKIQNQECQMLRWCQLQNFDKLLYTKSFSNFCFCFFFQFIDLLFDPIWHDLCYSFCCIGHNLLSKTKRIITKTMVMSIHQDSNRPNYYIISIQYDNLYKTKMAGLMLKCNYEWNEKLLKKMKIRIFASVCFSSLLHLPNAKRSAKA